MTEGDGGGGSNLDQRRRDHEQREVASQAQPEVAKRSTSKQRIATSESSRGASQAAMPNPWTRIRATKPPVGPTQLESASSEPGVSLQLKSARIRNNPPATSSKAAISRGRPDGRFAAGDAREAPAGAGSGHRTVGHPFDYLHLHYPTQRGNFGFRRSVAEPKLGRGGSADVRLSHEQAGM